MKINGQCMFNNLVVDSIVNKMIPFELKRKELEEKYNNDVKKIDEYENVILDNVEMDDDEINELWNEIRLRLNMSYKVGDKSDS